MGFIIFAVAQRWFGEGIKLGNGGAISLTEEFSFFCPLTSVTGPHVEGRYCCWPVNEGEIYTDIYVLLQEVHSFLCSGATSHVLAHFSHSKR